MKDLKVVKVVTEDFYLLSCKTVTTKKGKQMTLVTLFFPPTQDVLTVFLPGSYSADQIKQLKLSTFAGKLKLSV